MIVISFTYLENFSGKDKLRWNSLLTVVYYLFCMAFWWRMGGRVLQVIYCPKGGKVIDILQGYFTVYFKAYSGISSEI